MAHVFVSPVSKLALFFFGSRKVHKEMKAQTNMNLGRIRRLQIERTKPEDLSIVYYSMLAICMAISIEITAQLTTSF